MNKNHRTTLQIRKADTDMYNKLARFNFSAFVSFAMHKVGTEFIGLRTQEMKQGVKLPYVDYLQNK